MIKVVGMKEEEKVAYVLFAQILIFNKMVIEYRSKWRNREIPVGKSKIDDLILRFLLGK